MNSRRQVLGRFQRTLRRPAGGSRGGPICRAHGPKGRRRCGVLAPVCGARHVAKPVIFVGAGTCGLGAGAGKTLEAVREFLAQHQIERRRRRGRLQRHVLRRADRGHSAPGPGPREFRQRHGRQSAAACSTRCFCRERVPGDLVLGQYRARLAPSPGTEFPSWTSIRSCRMQVRVVLASSGIIDPGNIDEYIARGGYSASAQGAARRMTPDEVCDLVEKPADSAGAAAADSPPARSGSSREPP